VPLLGAPSADGHPAHPAPPTQPALRRAFPAGGRLRVGSGWWKRAPACGTARGHWCDRWRRRPSRAPVIGPAATRSPGV